MTYLAFPLSALLAGALTPVTAKVASRQVLRLPLLGLPLSLAITTVLLWASQHLTTVNFAASLAIAVVSAILATQFVIDLCVRRLLRELSYAGFALFLLLMLLVEPGSASGVRGALLGALLMTAVTALLVVVSKGALGLGDLHLSPLLGALIGWFSPSAVLLAWMITALTGALFTLVGLASKRLSRGTMIPYGPFMIFGTLAAVVVVSVRT